VGLCVCSGSAFVYTNHQWSCVPCAAGSYASFPDSQNCSFCAFGSFQPTAGQTACFNCPTAEYTLGIETIDTCKAQIWLMAIGFYLMFAPLIFKYARTCCSPLRAAPSQHSLSFRVYVVAERSDCTVSSTRAPSVQLRSPICTSSEHSVC
jgi:hypothetical protein